MQNRQKTYGWTDRQTHTERLARLIMQPIRMTA